MKGKKSHDPSQEQLLDTRFKTSDGESAEETKQRIMTRFYSWLLNQHYKVRISPSDLRSSDNERPVPEDILEKIDSDEFVDIVDYFEEHVIFSDESNPTGIKLSLYLL